MIQEKTIESGLSIYDYSNILLGGFDNIVKGLVAQNSFNFDQDLNAIASQPIIYDDAYYVDRSPQIQLPIQIRQTSIYSITAVNGQSVYDLNLQGYSGFDKIVQFMVDNNINSIDGQYVGGESVNFDKNLNSDISLRTIILKRGYIFATGVFISAFRVTEDDIIRVTEDGSPRVTE